MKNMKLENYYRISVFFAIVCVFQMYFLSTTSMAQDGRTLLVNALEVSGKSSFTSILKNPFYKEGKNTSLYQRTTDWKFYRFFSNGTMYIRLETLNENKVLETYIKNESGTYGLAPDGFAARILDATMLWFLELTHMDILPEEIQLSTFSVVQDSYNNVPCHKISMNTPQDDASLMIITGDEEQKFRENRENYLARRVFLREFWVGKKDNLIYCRKHYDRQGDLIFNVELGNVDENSKIPLSLFSTPKNVQKRYLKGSYFTSDAMREYFNLKKLDDRQNGFPDDISDSRWEGNYAKLIKVFVPPLSRISGYGIGTLSEVDLIESGIGVSYRISIRQTSVNKEGGLLAPKRVFLTKTVVNGQTIINNESNMQEQCGTYTFVINDNGDVTKITDFKYSGERNVALARGIGWSLFITRDDWKN